MKIYMQRRRLRLTYHPEEDRMFYARSMERPNVEEISNALGSPTRDQLHRVFLQVSLDIVGAKEGLRLLQADTAMHSIC